MTEVQAFERAFLAALTGSAQSADAEATVKAAEQIARAAASILAREHSPSTAPAVTNQPAPLLVVDVVQVVHEGQMRQLWDLTFSDGRVARTKDVAIRDLAASFRESQAPVDLTTAPSTKRDGLNVSALRLAS